MQYNGIDFTTYLKNYPDKNGYFGKYGGAYLSARLAKCDDTIVNYLGVTLLPQAGVALGLAMKAASLPVGGDLVQNITLFAVLIYELIGPLLTKIALTKSGDIDPEGKTSARHEHAKKKQQKQA